MMRVGNNRQTIVFKHGIESHGHNCIEGVVLAKG